MDHQFVVENIKCGGCANSIERALRAEEGVNSVTVDVAEGVVKVSVEPSSGAHAVEAARRRLAELGYPEQGSVHGFGGVGAKAKSFVSCAVGRMNRSDESPD